MKTNAQLSTDFSTITSRQSFNDLADSIVFRPVASKPEGLQHYPETVAKSSNRRKIRISQFDDTEALESDLGLSNNSDYFEEFIRDSAPPDPLDKIYRCSKGFIWGESSQNNFYKMICCGKEWCPDCGKKHSISHDRRINRIGANGQSLMENFLGLLQNGYSIQYLVITIPSSLRKLYRNKQNLNKFRNYWRDKLKREGYQVGFSRYHWAGEDGYLWKPHLNILTVGGFIPAKTLREWRQDLSRWFKMNHKLNNNLISNIHTSYTDEEGKVKHWVTYVNRATQTIYNKLNEDTIKGYRNCAPFKATDFEIPTYQREEREKSAEESAAAEGFDLLPDGTKEKIVWRMKQITKLQEDGTLKKIWRPEVVLIEHTRLDELKLIRRGFWKEAKFQARPDPEPEEFSAEIFCPF